MRGSGCVDRGVRVRLVRSLATQSGGVTVDDELTEEQLEFAQMLADAVRKKAERRGLEEARFRGRMEWAIRGGIGFLAFFLGAIYGRAQW